MKSDDGGALEIRLYIAGDSPNSLVAVANLRAALAQHAERKVGVEIIDVLATPERGLRDGVLMTPMLVRVAPAPEMRILGNLSDRAALAATLHLGQALRG